MIEHSNELSPSIGSLGADPSRAFHPLTAVEAVPAVLTRSLRAFDPSTQLSRPLPPKQSVEHYLAPLLTPRLTKQFSNWHDLGSNVISMENVQFMKFTTDFKTKKIIFFTTTTVNIWGRFQPCMIAWLQIQYYCIHWYIICTIYRLEVRLTEKVRGARVGKAWGECILNGHHVSPPAAVAVLME